MDDKAQILKEKLERLFREAGETAVALQAVERGAEGPVHFSQIEAAAHQIGRRLSCRIQERAAREVAADSPADNSLSGLRHGMPFDHRKPYHQLRGWTSEIDEPKGFCTRCRRAFFPSA